MCNLNFSELLYSILRENVQRTNFIYQSKGVEIYEKDMYNSMWKKENLG